jgi:hypothetical protein
MFFPGTKVLPGQEILRPMRETALFFITWKGSSYPVAKPQRDMKLVHTNMGSYIHRLVHFSKLYFFRITNIHPALVRVIVRLARVESQDATKTFSHICLVRFLPPSKKLNQAPTA